MSTTPNTTNREEWLKILGKGMVTIPKEWREELGIKAGDVIKAKKEGNKVIFESVSNRVPYRIYSAEEIDLFVKDDKLSPSLVKKVRSFVAKSK